MHTFLHDHRLWMKQSKRKRELIEKLTHTPIVWLLIYRGTHLGISTRSLSEGQYLYCSHGIGVTQRMLQCIALSTDHNAAVYKLPPLRGFASKHFAPICKKLSSDFWKQINSICSEKHCTTAVALLAKVSLWAHLGVVCKTWSQTEYIFPPAMSFKGAPVEMNDSHS